MTLSPSTKRREAGSPKPARRRVGRRLSVTHVLIAVVVILAFVLNLMVLQDRSATTLVAIAERPLTAGSLLSPSNVRLVPIESSFEGLDTMVAQEDLAVLDGWVLTRAIAEGEPVDRAALAQPGDAPGLRSMSLPIPVEHASGGSLTPGDRVDVISVVDSIAGFVASDLEVIGVAEDAGAAIGATSGYHVVVAVTAEEALSLAEALDSGSLEIVRSTGADEVGSSGS